MDDSLDALKERRSQIKAQITDNDDKFMLARFSGAPIAELKAIANQRDELEKSLADLNVEISRVEKALRDEQIRIQDEKRKADEQTKIKLERQKQEQAKTQWTDTESKLKRKRKLDPCAEKIIDILKVQITPSSECIEPNDAFIKALFRFGNDTFKKALLGKKFGVKEKKQTKKKDAVVSNFSLQNAEGYENDSPLSEFDRAVLGVLISEYLSGNRYTTVNIIFRALIGKVGRACDGVKIYANQLDAIANSVQKLMGTVVDFSGVSESLKELKYTDKDGNEIVLQSSNLLSADLLNAKVNGQAMEGVVFFKDISPLFHIADAKSQVIRYPHALLNVPNQNNTPRIISIKKYVLRRICEIKLHSQLTPTITFDDVFSKCRISHTSREVKRDVRNATIKLCEYLKAQNFISDFEVVKQRQKFVAIKFFCNSVQETVKKIAPDQAFLTEQGLLVDGARVVS